MNRRSQRFSQIRSTQSLRRGAALYVAVTGTTMIVSVLGLSAMAIVRIERKQAIAINERLLARSHARSAVELALRRINSEPAWRSTPSVTDTTNLSLGGDGVGSIAWKLEDADGDLDNSDGVLRLKGIGRIGNTVQVSSVGIQVGAIPLRSQTGYNDTGKPNHDDPWCQYLEVALPNGAIGWRITSVEILARSADEDEICNVRLYRPLANDTPSATVIDSADLPGSTVDGSWHWHSIAFSGSYWIAPGEGVCLALETAADDPIEFRYRNSGGSDPTSALYRPAVWATPQYNRALCYKIHGYYSNSTGVQPIPGTWDWDKVDP